MGIRFLSAAAGAALALAACGSSQSGQVPVDSPLTQFEAPESVPGEASDDDWFADDAFDDLDEVDDEDHAEPASKPSASEEGALAPAEKDTAVASDDKGQQAEADDAKAR